MRQDKFTSRFQTALSDAEQLALGADHQFLEPAHLLAALLAQQGSTVGRVLELAEVDGAGEAVVAASQP